MEGNVYTGIDNIGENEALLRGKRLALLTNPNGVTKSLVSTIDVLKDYGLSLLFAPEHGVRGDKQAGDKVLSFTDEQTGIPVISIYGGDREIPSQYNDQYDLLVIDIQDIGSRYYTYISALLDCLKSCVKNKKPVLILDRPNPIGGTVEGNCLEQDLLSYVGCYPMPQRHGLTIGEFALMVNDKEQLGCELQVAHMKNYKRDLYFDETGLPFVLPSPNMPTLDTAVLYNGTCLFEGTVLSEGRGTTKPFEMIGAPWLKAYDFAKTCNSLQLPGVLFRPVYFTPTFSKHKGELCEGVQVHIIDKKAVKPVELGIRMLYEAKKMFEAKNPGEPFFISPPFETDTLFIDKLAGTRELRSEFDPDTLLKRWADEAKTFEQSSKKHHLYS